MPPATNADPAAAMPRKFRLDDVVMVSPSWIGETRNALFVCLGDDLAVACEQLWVPHAGTERSLWMRGISGSQSSAFRILHEHLNWETVIDDVDAVVLVVFVRL
jgi:hypothetical protein